MLFMWFFTNANSSPCFITAVYIYNHICFSLVAPTSLGLIGRGLSPKAFFPLHSWLSKTLRVYPAQSHQCSFKYRGQERCQSATAITRSHHTVSLLSTGPVQPQGRVFSKVSELCLQTTPSNFPFSEFPLECFSARGNQSAISIQRANLLLSDGLSTLSLT